MWKRIKLDCYLTPYTKINPDGLGPETIKNTEENTGIKFMDLHLREMFVNLTPKKREIEAKINEQDTSN